MTEKISYKDAGVDIASGEETVQRIKEKVRTTFTPNVLTDIGRFGGFFALDLSQYKAPVLVSSIDGVGTKLKVAFMMDKHDTIGQDLVNHCINDILVGGAVPLYFLDYIGTGILEPHVVEAIISGMAISCKAAGCALIGGEMAEMPGFYQRGEYDVAGCITGIVEKESVIDGSRIRPGNVLIGLPSTGLHTNGFSLARKALFEKAGFKVDTYRDEINATVGEALLAVHRSYLPIAKKMMASFDILGMSHITGGGLIGNTKRILPDNCMLSIDWAAWEIPPIFQLIGDAGNIDVEEMQKVFNLGIGYVFIVDEAHASECMALLRAEGESPVQVGCVIEK